MNLPAPLAALAVATVFADVLSAQMDIPPGAMPLITPPVDHPALLGQPAWTSPPASERPDAAAETPDQPRGGPTAEDPAELRAREFVATRVAGRDLELAVRRVTDLKWYGRLPDARAAAAARGLPILWLQSLGDLEGFA